MRFLLVGLSAANAHGATVVTADVDLWFEDLRNPVIRETALKVGGVYVSPTALTPPQLGGTGMDLFDVVTHASGLESFAKEYRRSKWMMVGGVRLKVLPLERIIVSKRAANRPKDRLVLPVLEDAVTTMAALRRRKARR